LPIAKIELYRGAYLILFLNVMRLDVGENFSAVQTSASRLIIKIKNPNNWPSLGKVLEISLFSGKN
jgi:hypothetical protein